MDKNTVAGIFLIAIILIGYSLLTNKDKEELETLRRKKDSLEQVQSRAISEQKAINDSIQKNTTDKITDETTEDTVAKNEKTQNDLHKKYGAFAEAATGKPEKYIIENNLIRAEVSNKGGRIYSVELKNYQTYDSSKLVLFDGDSNTFGLNFFAKNRSISTNDFYFKPIERQGKHLKAVDTPQELKLRLYAGNNKYIEYTYIIKPDSYMLDFDIRFVNMGGIIAQNINNVDLNWEMYAPSLEKGKENENYYTTIYYKYFKDDVDNLNARSDKDKEEKLSTKIKWVAFKHQFFSSVLIHNDAFSNGLVKYNVLPDTSRYLKKFIANTTLLLEDKDKSLLSFNFYFGPNHFNTLKQYGNDLLELVQLGAWILKWINRFAIIPIFNFLNNYISNYGIIILLLTIIIKIVLFPLTYKSYASMAKMKVLKPQIDEINKKIPKEKAMERQQAQMKLYRKAGVSPMGGCLPLLLQMPILIAMYRFFPASIELRQEGFLWANDLSTYDSILNLPFSIPFYGDHVSLFTILMTITTIITMRFSNQASASSSQMPGMKSMMYVMPVMLLFVLNNFSSALTYYLFLSNLITVGQNAVSKRFINEEDILRKINENKKKPQKKSNFQSKLEKMAKERGYKPPKKK